MSFKNFAIGLGCLAVGALTFGAGATAVTALLLAAGAALVLAASTSNYVPHYRIPHYRRGPVIVPPPVYRRRGLFRSIFGGPTRTYLPSGNGPRRGSPGPHRGGPGPRRGSPGPAPAPGHAHIKSAGLGLRVPAGSRVEGRVGGRPTMTMRGHR